MVGCWSPPAPLPENGGTEGGGAALSRVLPPLELPELGASDYTQPRGLGSEAGVCRGQAGAWGNPQIAVGGAGIPGWLIPPAGSHPWAAHSRRSPGFADTTSTPRGQNSGCERRAPPPSAARARGDRAERVPHPPAARAGPFRTADSARPLAVNRGGSCGLAGGPLGNQPPLDPERVGGQGN